MFWDVGSPTCGPGGHVGGRRVSLPITTVGGRYPAAWAYIYFVISPTVFEPGGFRGPPLVTNWKK